MAKPDLLDSSDSEDDQDVVMDEKASNGLVINKRYAKDFQLRKQREDLRQHAATLDEDDDSSSSSDEDEEGALLTTKLDTNILKTIHALRSKDARIYDPKVRFFDDKDGDADDGKEETKKHKPKRYKDVIREQALEQIEKGSDGDDSDNGHDDRLGGGKSHRLAYDKEQEDIRKSFLQSTKGFDDDNSSNDDDNDDDGSDGLLVVKKKDPKQIQQEEQEFEQEIQRIESTLQKGKKDADYVDPKGEVDDGSKFLLNYFKNRSWIDKDKLEDDDSSDEDEDGAADAGSDWKTRLAQQEADETVPMKTGDADDGNESDTSLNQLDKTDDFEAQYNFRFEEAAGTQSGADFSLISYARGQTVNTLRRKDESRREKRLARKERKAAERKAKEEELKRLKNLKRKEMERKLHEVKKVVGLAEEDADMDEAAILKLIEGDYDPDEFEKKMQETFGDDFYAKEDKEWKSDKDVRATLMTDEDGNMLVGDDNEGDMYDTVGDEADDSEGANEENEEEGYWGEEDEEEYYEGDQGEEGDQETQLEKKIKAKMEDELYKLDYEDIVAGMPTRFKYRQVEPNAYGLSTEEILFARDTTLKQFVSLKKMAPYREDGEFTVGGKRRRKFREQLKQEIEEEMGASEEKNDGGKGAEEPAQKAEEPEASSKKRKRRKSKKNKSGEKDDSNKHGEEKPPVEETPKPVATPKPAAIAENEDDNAGDDPEKANAEPKRKRRRRQKKKKSTSTDGDDDGDAGKPEAVEMKEDTPKPANAKKEKVRKDSDASTSANKDQPKRKDTPPDKAKDIAVKAKKKDKKHKKEKKDRTRDKKKGKKSKIDGISQSRLSSYGL